MSYDNHPKVAVAGTAACVALAASATALTAPAGTHVNTTHTATLATPRSFATGFLDPWSFGATDQGAAFDNARRAGASFVRIFLHWTAVAPVGSTIPAGFGPAIPVTPVTGGRHSTEMSALRRRRAFSRSSMSQAHRTGEYLVSLDGRRTFASAVYAVHPDNVAVAGGPRPIRRDPRRSIRAPSPNRKASARSD